MITFNYIYDFYIKNRFKFIKNYKRTLNLKYGILISFSFFPLILLLFINFFNKTLFLPQLDSCEEYEDRKRIRMRLKTLMAEKKGKIMLIF